MISCDIQEAVSVKLGALRFFAINSQYSVGHTYNHRAGMETIVLGLIP